MSEAEHGKMAEHNFSDDRVRVDLLRLPGRLVNADVAADT